MGLVTADQNESVPTTTSTTENANIYHARHIVIDKPLNDPAGMTIEVMWSRCYDNAGVLVTVESRRTFMNAAEVGPYLMQAVVDGNTLERDFKEKLWAALAAKEGLPAGAIV